MPELEPTSARTLHSLRSRYLFSAACVSVLLIGGAVLANWYSRDVSSENSRVLKLQDEVTARIGEIRNTIWTADIALNANLISPRTEHERDILSNLGHAKNELDVLAANPAINTANLTPQVRALGEELVQLTEKVQYLMLKRQDPNWVYPLLPYIDQKLLEPNNDFETAAAIALREIAEDDGRSYASQLYGRFDEVRDLWRLKILNFRAVIIRFAGLNNTSMTAQEQKIGELHERIETRLAALQSLQEQGKLGLESEVSLETMQEASKRWQENWSAARQLRSSSIWRADIRYMETVIRPHQQQVFNALTAIEKSVLDWSAGSVVTVQQAASQISNSLWGLAGLALGFVILVYLMIERSVLQPIARIADTMSTQGEGSRYRPEKNSSREIHQLVTAFNVMRKQIHQRQLALEHQTMHDTLTGLPNRILMLDRLEQAMQIMRRNEQTMAFLLLDLDRFKEVNDALGHQVGDRLLQQVGQRLESMLRESDTVARLGGDEFAIVAPNTDSEQAIQFAEKISKAINDVFPVDEQNLYVGVSIGVAVYPQHSTDASTLIRYADIAMYVAKRNNLDCSLYEASHDEHRTNKLALVGELHEELINTRQLQLYYQPQIDLFSREVVAAEALLRWDHPQLGFISPEHIVSMSEHTGLIAPLTQWVIDTALLEADSFQQSGLQLGIAVNLSAWNLQDPTLPAAIDRTLQKYAIPAEKLTLEITESAMMNDPVRARKVLEQLSDMGIKLAIDDFGTGFSSLGYLKLLPVNDIKIDKSFVIDMQDDENDAIIVHSTIELAHNLGLNVIAEGVENQETLLHLRQRKCDMAQGYHISRPLPKDDFKQWLEKYRLKIAR